MFFFDRVSTLVAAVIFLLLVPVTVLAQDFDPFDPNIPRSKAEQAYKDAIKQRDGVKDADARERFKPFLRALKEHLKGRGSKFDDKGNLLGDGAPVADGDKKPAKPANKAGSAKPADTGFRFGGLKFGQPTAAGVKDSTHGIGASWYVICLDIDITGSGSGYNGKIRDLKLLAYSHSMMSPKTVEGLKTAAHELEHVKQYKHAWEMSHEALRKGFSVSGKTHDDVKNAAKDIVDKWFGPGFNRHFTGKASRKSVSKKYQRVTGSDPREIKKATEYEPEIAEKEFGDEFKGKPGKAKKEIDKRSNGLKTAETPPNVKHTHTVAHGNVRVKIRLFEKNKQVALLEPAQYMMPDQPVEQGFAVSYDDPNICVASVFYASGRQMLGNPNQPLVSITSPVIARTAPPSDEIPDCTPVPGLTSTPEQPTPPGITTTPKSPEQPSDQEQQPEITSKPPEEDQPDETPELGLVKAQETLVSLILTNEDDGKPLEGAIVKLLAPEPDLPAGDGDTDTQLTGAEHYSDGVEGLQLGDDAKLLLSANPQSDDDLLGIKLTEVADEQADTSAHPTGTPQATRTAKVASQNPQLVVAAAAGGSRLPARLAPQGAKICVNRNFRIGDNNIHVVSLPEQYLEEFTRNANSWEEAQFVEPDPCRNKEDGKDPLYGSSGLWGQKFDNQWAIKRVGFEEGKLPQWLNKPSSSPDITVAVIDTGLDWYHPDIAHEKIWTNPGEVPGNGVDDDNNGYVDDIVGWNFVRNRNKPWDYDGHGTFVTGVIAAAQNNGIGISGISSSAKIMPLKALDAFGRGYASMAAEAINYAAEQGARVINLSLGGRTLTKVEQLAIDHAKTRGAIVVVAAGNSGQPVAEFSPAGLRGVLTVTATDRNDKRAGFSNWGPLVDVAAPGVDVLSLRARRTDLLALIRGVKYKRGEGILGEDKSYYRASGTSFAAPIVTGTITELLARNPKLDAEQVTRMILHSARDIETPGVDNYTGYGLLDASAALAADPEYFNESRISGVKVVTRKGKPVLRVVGTADANEFKEAVFRLGKGSNPKKWFEVNVKIAKPVNANTLIELPAGVFKGAKQWTIRLITRHKNGSEREARFSLKLG